MTDRTDDAYTDARVHYETCNRCRPQQPCPVAVALQRREEEGKKR